MNTLEAIGAAHLLGISPREIKQAIADVNGIRGRLERVRIDGKVGFSVYIDYAHTPDALESVLRSVRGSAGKDGRIVLLFGCGGDREKQKRALMGRIAVEMADHVIITSDNSRSESPECIIEDILSGIVGESSYTVIEDRREAIEYAIRCARDGDVIILAGKGHEEYEIVGDERRPFCEKDIVRQAVEKFHS
jgi:UDP-N-acetylmuramoyl-L-alanyl-D-glutamate--2,6-diaminopimelate ligase